MCASAPSVLLVEDSITASLCSIFETSSDLGGCCQIYPRHLVKWHILELNKAEHGARFVSKRPYINSAVIVCVLKIALCQSPGAVLAALHRNLQQLLAADNDEVIFWLIRAILDR